jgi:hypothetical protein
MRIFHQHEDQEVNLAIFLSYSNSFLVYPRRGTVNCGSRFNGLKAVFRLYTYDIPLTVTAFEAGLRRL